MSGDTQAVARTIERSSAPRNAIITGDTPVVSSHKRAYEITIDTARGALESLRAQELTTKTKKPSGIIRARASASLGEWREMTLEALEELELERPCSIPLRIGALLA